MSIREAASGKKPDRIIRAVNQTPASRTLQHFIMSNSHSHPLRFTKTGIFTIVQFTDLHWHNGDAADQQTARLIRQVLDSQKPDLVVVSGDVIDGAHCDDPLKSWEQSVAPIIDRHLPWAAVFGNHDDEGTVSRAQLMTAMQSLPGCLASAGPANLSGVGNYTMTIADSAGNQPAARLYFLDSGGYANRVAREYAWIQKDQIDWYLRLEKNPLLPALMFFHIPLPEVNDVWDAGHCVGSKHETVCCPKKNSGMFDALKSAGDVLGVFVGHDHVNDYVGELSGIKLCYGRATGFNTYGRDGFPRGARVIRLREGRREFETWVELDSE